MKLEIEERMSDGSLLWIFHASEDGVWNGPFKNFNYGTNKIRFFHTYKNYNRFGLRVQFI